LLPRRIRRPRRRKPMIGTELLDDPRADPELVGRELRDIARLNALFGGTRAVVRELEPLFERGKRQAWTLLDVGTGLGDIPRAAAAAARRHGITLRLVGIELNRTAARLAQGADDGRGAGKGEFDEMLRDAGVRAVARYRPGCRIVASWSPGASLQ